MSETLNNIRNRPRFKLYTHLSPEEYETNLKSYLAKNTDTFSGNINREVATIFVKTEEESYWKPNLALRIEKEENMTVIRGIFGPSSAVWTFFMFLYFLFSIAWMVFFTLYFVEKQIKSNDYPWALSLSFVVLGLIFLTYAAAKFGQVKSKKEMTVLRKFAEESTYPIESNR